MARAGLSTERVVAEAAVMADEHGLHDLTLAALASRLGVRQPSLYKHIDGLNALRRLLALRAKAELADVLGAAAIGRAREEALVAVADAFRGWAREHPGLYEAVQRPASPGDDEDEAVSTRLVGVLAAVMSGYGLEDDDAVDAIRAFRSAVHGFVALEAAGGFGLPASTDRSFDRLVHAVAVALGSWSTVTAPGGQPP